MWVLPLLPLLIWLFADPTLHRTAYLCPPFFNSSPAAGKLDCMATTHPRAV